MTHEEVYRELERDRDNIDRWFSHRYDEYRRRALKVQRFPVTWWLDYTSPRKNRYLIAVTCTRRNYERFHALTIVALRKEAYGHTVYLTYIGKHALVRKTVFLQHVFDQYHNPERGNVQKTGLDLIRHFLERQTSGRVLNNPMLAGRSVRYEGRDHHFLAINDGVVMGDVVDGIFIARTFITYEMATGRQHEEFTGAKEKIPDIDTEVRYVRDHSNKDYGELIKL